MGSNLEELLPKLSLLEEEKGLIVVEDDWIEDSVRESQRCLMGKLWTKKGVNTKVMRQTLMKIWRVSKGMTLREVGDKIYIFSFEDNIEKERALLSQPWTFNKALLVLGEVDGFTTPDKMKLDWCPFWVQAYGLPIGLMNQKIGIILGETVGEVEEIDAL
ncbi:hypothetical protein REPUB_Repub05bG0143600 [Reevesia pubescens]